MVPAQMESDASGVSGLCGKSGISQTDSSWNPPLDRLCSRDTVCGGSFKDGPLRNAAVYCRYFPAIYFLCTGISSIDPVLLSLSAK